MIDIQLTDEQDRAAYDAAVAINNNKEALGKPNVAWTKAGREIDPLQTRWHAFRAEYAAALALGLPAPRWEIFSGGDGKIDLWLPLGVPQGRSCQVKYRSERERDLATGTLDFHDELRADVYILAWPGHRQREITLVGYCVRDEFLKRIISRPPARFLGKRYEMLWASELRPVEDLIDAVEAAKHPA